MNLTDNSQIHIQKRKSSDERELMEIKKRKSETHNEDFHKHVLEVSVSLGSITFYLNIPN